MGLGSRREIEGWISAGRIRVNGKVAELGAQVRLSDKVEVDGRVVSLRPVGKTNIRVLLLNKAEGVVCSRHDPEGRPTIFDKLPALPRGRWINIGRLDINSSGLLLMTNDGELAHRMMHPSYVLDREYAARVDSELNRDIQQILRDGVLLEDGMARFTDIRHYGGGQRNHWYHVTLLEGRNREVRRLFESQQMQVSRLKRVRFGPVVLPSALKRGQVMEMSPEDIRQLLPLLDLPVPDMDPPDPRQKRRMVKSVLMPYPPLAERQAQQQKLN